MLECNAKIGVKKAMEIVHALNLGARFLLELCALAALGYWGLRTGQNGLTKALLGLGAPLLAAVVWGTFVAPKASVSLPGALRLGLECLVFAAAVAALLAVGKPALAGAFAAVALSNRVLMYLWKQ